MSWLLNSSDLPVETLTRQNGLELFELGNKDYKAPLFKSNPISSKGFSNTEIPFNNDFSEGYIPVEDTSFVLTLESTIKVYKLTGDYSISGFTQIFNLANIAEDTYIQDGNYTFVFTTQNSITGNTIIELEVPNPTSNLVFNFDLTEYSLDSVSLVSVLGLEFIPSFVNNIVSFTTNTNCRPFPKQIASIQGSKTFDSNFVLGSVFDLTSLTLDYVDSISHEGQHFIFSSTIQSGSLTYNPITKRVYLWQ